MNGPEHYQEAERLLKVAADPYDNSSDLMAFTPKGEQEIRDFIWEEVLQERQRQIAKGYTLEKDDRSTAREMSKYANWRFTRKERPAAEWFGRQTFIEAIAILVAAVEVMDRRRAREEEADDQPL